MEPSRSLFTRQQVGKLAGLDDTTLNYWSREGLIIPTEGGSGRGSHRRFDFVQVNIAAILGQLRRFGLNISVMRSFSNLLQDAANLGSGRELHPSNFLFAANIANKLHKFRTGVPVMISKHDPSTQPPDLYGKAYSDWLLAKRPAKTEKEIIDRLIGYRDDYDSIHDVVAIAERIGPGKEVEAEIYAQLVYDILAPGYSSSYSWLLGFGPDETWRIEFGSEGGNFFDQIDGPSSEDFGPGIFLPVSGIIRRVWGLKTPQQYMRDREAKYIQAELAEANITATVTPSDRPEQGFNIDAPGVQGDLIDAVLNKIGYRSPSGEGNFEADN